MVATQGVSVAGVDWVPPMPVVRCSIGAGPAGGAVGSLQVSGHTRDVAARDREALLVGVLVESAQLAQRMRRPVRLSVTTEAGTRLFAAHTDFQLEPIQADGVLGERPGAVLHGACGGCGMKVSAAVRFCTRCGKPSPLQLYTLEQVPPPLITPSGVVMVGEQDADLLVTAQPGADLFETLSLPQHRNTPSPLVAAHPVAGASTWALLLHEEEVAEPPAEGPWVLVCRSTPAGVQSAKKHIGRWGCERLRAVLVVADAPGRVPRAADRELKILGGAVRVVRAPWVPGLRGVVAANLNAQAGPLIRPAARVRAALDRVSASSPKKEHL